MVVNVSGVTEYDFNTWFSAKEIDEFKSIFVQHGFTDLDTVKEIRTNEELKEMGIVLLGNQLKYYRKSNR